MQKGGDASTATWLDTCQLQEVVKFWPKALSAQAFNGRAGLPRWSGLPSRQLPARITQPQVGSLTATSSLQTVTTCTVASMTGFLLVPAAYFLPLGG